MRLLADENVHEPVVRVLRNAGHDGVWAAELMPTAPDVEVLAAAQQRDRVVLTLDRDFGDLTFNKRQPARSGVILVRDYDLELSADPCRILEILVSKEPWEGNFTTLIPGESPRVRPIPWD